MSSRSQELPGFPRLGSDWGNARPHGPPAPPFDPPNPRDLMECSASLPNPMAVDGDLDDEVRPAPASIGADVPLSYFGPAPSDSNPRLIGPLQLLTAGTLDLDAGTVQMPLYEGRLGSLEGPKIWYVVTDTTDAANAEALGLNHAPKLHYAATGAAVRTGHYEVEDGRTLLVFDQGTVDFAPEHRVTPGPEGNEFPPAEFQPGSVGDADYSPLVRIVNAGDHVYNASMIAFDVGEDALTRYCGHDVDGDGHALVHDKVLRICPQGSVDAEGESYENAGTVTLSLTLGFSFGRPVSYLSLEANDALPATLEAATLAPGLADVSVGADDSLFSGVERIFVTINGPTNGESGRNPQRQGLNSALRGEGGPLNVLGGIPTIATDYSPLWDLNVGMWTEAAVERGYRARVTEEFQILGYVDRGFLTGPGGAPYASTGFVVNCPIVHRFL